MSHFEKEKRYSLRDVIGNYVKILGEKNPKVLVLNADLMGTSRNRSFVETFPERSFNVGIAEQNMVSFAAGLAHEGFIPFAFSMAPFVTMRACEQCRTDVAYGNLNVKLMGSYAGYSGGISGATHWALEDCAIMTAMNNMAVIEPSDPYIAEKLMELSIRSDCPWYVRYGVQPVEVLYDENINVELGKSITVCNGNDGAFICSGVIVGFAKKASEYIKYKYGKNIRVIDMYSIKPIDKEAIICAAKTGYVVIAQDHNKIGGLGQLVATVIAEEGIATKLKILGCNSKFETMAHADYLYHKNEYDVEGLIKHMLLLIGINEG